MPVGQTLAIPSMAGGVFTSIFEYYGFELTAVFYPHITDKKNTMKFIILASLISMLFYIFNAIVLTGFFGENMLRHEVFPLYSLARSYKTPIIERADFFFMVIWFTAMCATIKAFLYSTYYSIIKLFKIRKPTLFLMFFIAGMVILSLIPKDTQSLYSFKRILNISGIAAAYIYPAVCYAFSFSNKRGIQSKEKSEVQK
jgi:hypothetical protein